MALQIRAEAAVREAVEWTEDEEIGERVKKRKTTSERNKKKRKKRDELEDRFIEDDEDGLSERRTPVSGMSDNEVGSGVKKPRKKTRKLERRGGEKKQKARLSGNSQHIWKLPKELRIQIWRYLVAPEEGIRRDFRGEPGRSLFNISLSPLCVAKRWREEIKQVWDEHAFTTIRYPDFSPDYLLDDALKKVRNLRVEVKFYDNMDLRNVRHDSHFVRACDMISEAHNSEDGCSRLQSIKIEFCDVRERNDTLDPTILFAGLCQGLQLLRSDVVRTSGLPPRVEESLKSELLSKKPAIQLPTMISALLSAWGQLCIWRQSLGLSLNTIDAVRKKVDEAVSACTVKDFLDHRRLCVSALGPDRVGTTFKEMIFCDDAADTSSDGNDN